MVRPRHYDDLTDLTPSEFWRPIRGEMLWSGSDRLLNERPPSVREPIVHAAQGHPVQVRVEAHGLPALPAAVEVAAFRIATEAVMNSARHSGTEQAWVQIRCQDGCLEVSVRDTGSTVGSWVRGVGLSSMRERAAEVGGTIQMTTNPEGSLVRALIPLP